MGGGERNGKKTQDIHAMEKEKKNNSAKKKAKNVIYLRKKMLKQGAEKLCQLQIPQSLFHWGRHEALRNVSQDWLRK